MTWDQPSATWDSSTWDAPPISPATPHQPRSHLITVTRQTYFPVRIGDQIVWLRNFKLRLPDHAATLALDPADVTNVLLDVDTAIYGLDNYRGSLSPAQSSCYECIEIALYGDNVPGNVTWLGFTPPAGAPAARPNGALKRVFSYINDEIKDATGYNDAIGESLGTEAPATPPPPPGTTAPDFDLRSTTGGKLEVLWTKLGFDGVRLEFDLGGGVVQSDIDLRPNYTLNWLPPAGQSAVIKVRLRYLLKGEDFGNWSEWRTWTLTGA
ncbi:MAG: hypothetical protein HS117_13410 [Verrucomicrobiaceae bacterium]|jgi:hypothetical protein|nr:hypothetical protein [Verrucomicrobiaceae bacterium]